VQEPRRRRSESGDDRHGTSENALVMG
jgi:hypothetical protein